MGAQLTYTDPAGVRLELHLDPSGLPTVRAAMLALVGRLLDAEDLVVAGDAPAGRRRPETAPAAAPGGDDSPGAGDQSETAVGRWAGGAAAGRSTAVAAGRYHCSCGRAFASSVLRSLHQTEDGCSYPCGQCNRTFASSQAVALHRTRAHGPTSSPAPAAAAAVRLAKKTCELDGCDVVFQPRRAEDRYHSQACREAQRILRQRARRAGNGGGFGCGQCDRSFATQQGLDVHVGRAHKAPFQVRRSKLGRLRRRRARPAGTGTPRGADEPDGRGGEGRMNDTSWMKQAACRDLGPDLFFTERGEPTKDAKAVCQGCPVREDCLEYALDTGQHYGIWGGVSERGRRRLRRGRGTGRRRAS